MGTKKRQGGCEFQVCQNEKSVVTLIDHKYGGALSLLMDASGEGEAEPSLKSMPPLNSKKEPSADSNESSTQLDNSEDENNEIVTSTIEEVDFACNENDNDNTDIDKIFDGKNENNDDEDNEENDDNKDQIQKTSCSDASSSQQQAYSEWYWIKAANNKVLLQSLLTGYHLGISADGILVLTKLCDFEDSNFLWDVEIVTGELLFCSNKALDLQMRCDMRGRLSLVQNRKGWEAFRFLEVSHGFVKITSWMHHTWALSCNNVGDLSTRPFHDNNDAWCCLWAVEISPMGDGVVIRSKTYGRFLCVADSQTKKLATYHPLDDAVTDAFEDVVVNTTKHLKLLSVSTTSEQHDLPMVSQGDFLQQALKQKKTNSRRGWFHRFSSSLDSSSLDEEVQQQNPQQQPQVDPLSPLPSSPTSPSSKSILPSRETIVWQLEAAHSQQYYLSTSTTDERSIGPFPEVNTNLRRTDTFQLMRTNPEGHLELTQLYHVERQQYVACDAAGTITLVDDATDESTEWIMERWMESSGSVFKSKVFPYYLSYADVSISESANMSGDGADNINRNEDNDHLKVQGEIDTRRAAQQIFEELQNEEIPIDRKKSEESNQDNISSEEEEEEEDQHNRHGHLSLFHRRGKKNIQTLSQLVGSETMGPRESWKLAPCMPRAVNSGKIKTFAVGTSLVVGSSLALPFALAGASAMFAAAGAHVGVVGHVVIAGVSSLDAISSFGAVGATAYLVFRPEGNSLTDDHQQDEEDEAERAWSKRPFSDWRNW